MPRRSVVCGFVLAAGCGPKPAPHAMPAHHVSAGSAAPDAAIAVASASEYPEEWGACTSDNYYSFGPDNDMIELADCDIDPQTDDAEARPRNHVAHLVLRRADTIVANEELGEFVPWEEGTHWLFPGVIETPDHRSLALPLFDSGSMGPDSGSYTLHGYILDGDHFTDIYQLNASQLEVTIAPDHSNARLHSCDGSCEADPDKATYQDLVLTFDGTKVTAK